MSKSFQLADQHFIKPWHQADAGFTLLEMLLVIVLMGSAAAMSFALLGNHQNQTRYDDTLRRLESMRVAIVGDTGATWGGERRLSGFVAENGRLPSYIREVTSADLADATECIAGGLVDISKLDCYKLRSPIFDPAPDATGLSNGTDGINLTASNEKLLKGQRSLLATRTGSTKYRDAWGNVGTTDDADNFGWVVQLPTSVAEPFKMLSMAANNAVDVIPLSNDQEYVNDIGRNILVGDWSQELAGWAVRVSNNTAISQPASGFLAVSLLVYENALGGGKWRRYTSNFAANIAPGDSADLTFPVGGYPLGTMTTQISEGEHLLVVVQSQNGVAHDADDIPLEQPVSSGNHVVSVARFYAHAGRPVMNLVLQ